MKEWFKEHWKEITIVALAVLMICLLAGGVRLCENGRRQENNIKALMDSVKTLKLSNGEILSEKQSYILHNNELEEYIGISNKERKELERKLRASLDKIAKLQGTIIIDTVICHDSVYIKDGITFVDFEFDDNWLSLTGSTRECDGTYTTSVDNISMRVPLKVGWTQDKKCFVSTDNPHVTFGEIEAAEMNTKDNKPKHWNVGLQVGIGVQYGVIHKTFDVGPYIGVGISYGFNF